MEENNEIENVSDLPVEHRFAVKVLAAVAGLAATIMVERAYLAVFNRSETTNEDQNTDE